MNIDFYKKLDWKHILIDSVIIFVLTFFGGLVVGLLAGLTGAQLSLAMLGLVNVLCASAGFAIASYRKTEDRWPHLFVVALIFWLTGLINVITGFTNMGGWLTSLVPSLVFMAIGGGIGMALRTYWPSK